MRGAPPLAMKYLQNALKSTEIKGRNLTELQTIAVAVDWVLKGQLERGLEVLLQRFKSVESFATGTLSSSASGRLEVIQRQGVSALTPEEMEEAHHLDRSWRKYENH